MIRQVTNSGFWFLKSLKDFKTHVVQTKQSPLFANIELLSLICTTFSSLGGLGWGVGGMGFTKRKGGLVSGLARSTFLLVEKGELKSLVHRLFVSLLVYTPQLRFSKQSKKHSHTIEPCHIQIIEY